MVDKESSEGADWGNTLPLTPAPREDVRGGGGGDGSGVGGSIRSAVGSAGVTSGGGPITDNITGRRTRPFSSPITTRAVNSIKKYLQKIKYV